MKFHLFCVWTILLCSDQPLSVVRTFITQNEETPILVHSTPLNVRVIILFLSTRCVAQLNYNNHVVNIVITVVVSGSMPCTRFTMAGD